MSLIFGIIKHEEYDIDEEHHFQKLYEPLKRFPQEKFSKSVHNEAVFGKILTYGTPEDVFDRMPVFMSEQNILFTAQGRVDNREELANNLEIKLHDILSDSYFMLQAYLKYGDKVQNYLKGDWSLAAYDFNKKDVFIARDTMGNTSLYYYQTEKYFAFSSSIKSFLDLPDFKKGLNEEYFVWSLTNWKIDESKLDNQTIFQQIYHLPNGYVLEKNNNVTTLTKYWPLDNVREIYYKNKQDYADEMLELMYKSVDVRLRSYKTVASMLSGGLDSSTVSYIAADILKQENKQLTTFSHVPLYKEELLKDKLAASRVLDETPFIESIVKASGNIIPQYLNSANITPLQGIKKCVDILDGTIHGASNAFWIIDILETTFKKGFGTLLTGEGGNGSISFSALDYLNPQNLNAFLLHPRSYLKRKLWNPLKLKYAFPLVIAKQKDFSLSDYIGNGYLSSNLIKEYDILSDIKKNKKGLVRYYKNIQELKLELAQLYNLRSLVNASFGYYYGIDLRDPTVDIDVMNYFFSIPNSVFFDDNFNNRMLVKRMMAGKIPTDVLLSNKKGLQGSDVYYRLNALPDEFYKCNKIISDNNTAKNILNTRKLEFDMCNILKKDNKEISITQNVLKGFLFGLFIEKNF